MDIASFCKMLPDKVDEKFDRKCSEIAQEIFKGNATIVDLIEQLRPYLTNIDPTQRELGVLALTIVLESLPIDFLNAQQIKVLATFYADILKGHHVILPTVFKGILRIIQFKHFPEEVIPTLLNTFLQNVACQQQQQADRYSIYCIFQNMFDLYRTALLSMGMDFVYVVITSIDGERDPRNLVFLFKWLQRFLQHVSLGHLSEEMFEVLACYFPVDFKAPPSESAITRDMLSEALSPCLCSRSEFGEFAIPLALEKLDSSLNIAKLDSLKLLKDGCDHFPAPVYIENFQKIWNQLHKELFTTSSNEIRSLCLETLTAVVKRTSTDPVHYVKVKPMLQDICDTVKGNLLPDSKLFEPSADILLHIARGSQHSSALVIKEIVPFLTNTINITSTSPHKEKLMKYLLEFTIAYLTFHDRLSDELNDVPMIFLKAAVEGDRMLQERGYDYLGQIARHLPTEVRAVVYNNIHTLIINNDVVMLDCLKGLAEAYPDEVNASIFHKTELNSVPAVTTYLNSLSYLINLPRFTEMVVANLLGYFQKPEYTTIAVDCMRSLLVTKQMNNNVLAEFISNDAVDKLVRFSLEQTADEGMLLKISEIMKILIGLQDSDVQENILQMHLERIQSQLKQRELTVILLDGLLLRLNRDVRISYDVLDVLLNMAMESRSETVIDTCVKLLANLLNKKDNDENFHSYVEQAKEKCLEAISTRKDTALSLLVWFTKALLMKNYPDCFICADLLLMLLDQYPELGSYLKIIMNSSYECLSDTSHCNCMPLYRQKFFVYVTNKIADRLDNVVYLKVVGHLIEYAPEQAVQFQFKKIRKMILMCLEKCNEPPVLCVLLRCIKRIVKDDSEAVESSLDDFLLRVLKLTTFKDSLDVRVEALQCLSVMTVAFPVYKLLPHKNTVIHHLAACTDDRKRLVRKEAMDARSLWFLLDAPV
ncbi:unnamed protein product [Acanthoscelides obtectus]|uniref:MMS19 nucleotide excision repair protein n=1 Tax=Acanthoscelides obtectus TaxID=200917 RepID=A0A9P0KAM1_ACAOB|nr:unnamed protein product [Acanthoscelides obtectus]CAK1643707.1 MMS19 nucleotide excision repair protein homolog [Acanthoscelides obtectus]